MKNYTVKLVFCVVVIVGCATTDTSAVKDESKATVQDKTTHATITFEKGYLDGVGFGTASAQEYRIVKDNGCRKPKKMARFSWISGKKKEKKITVGEPVELIASNINYSSGGGYWNGYAYISSTNSDICQSKLTFTPQAGRSYYMRLVEESVSKCVLEFYDEETKKTPEDASIINGFRCE